MARQKRSHSDSVEVQTTLMRDAIKGKTPPAHLKLTDEEMPFWNSIISARADWTEIDLGQAVALARIQCMIEKQSKLLAEETPISKTASGATIVNPRMQALKALATLSLNYSVKMQVHSYATVGPLEDVVTKNQQKRAMIESINGDDEYEGLIAKPN